MNELLFQLALPVAAARAAARSGHVGGDGRVGDHAHAAIALPEGIGVTDALRMMQAEREQLAIVVDEYGPLRVCGSAGCRRYRTDKGPRPVLSAVHEPRVVGHLPEGLEGGG